MSDLERSYTEMAKRETHLARFRYLKLTGQVGIDTFGWERFLNQEFYKSREWKNARDLALIRDHGCDLGVRDYPIVDKVFVHHMNPLKPEDLQLRNWARLIDPENLICVTQRTHNAIHFGDESLLPQPLIERRPGDHIAWKE